MFSLTSSRPKSSLSSSHQRSKSSPFLAREPASSTISPYDYDSTECILAPPPPSATTTVAMQREPRKLHKRALTSTSPTRAVRSRLEPLQTQFPEPGPSSHQSPALLPASVFSASDISFDLSPPHSPPLSPSKEKWSFLSTFKAEKADGSSSPKRDKAEIKTLRLADWFQGESEPMNITILPPQKKEEEEIVNFAMAMAPTSVLQRTSTLLRRPESPTKSSSPSPGRFSFLTSKLSSPSQPSLANISEGMSDEFVTLDIKKSLQPQGSADPFSPSAFKNLMQNAEGLLSRMQVAYKQRIQAVEEVNAELETQAEETEEAQTRAQHLKLQLDDLSAKNAEQDSVIMGLVEELAKEKELRRQDAEARARSVRVVPPTSDTRDLPRRRKRTSGRVSSGSTVSDSGFESNDEAADTFSISERGVDSASASVNYSPDTPQSVFSSPHTGWKGGFDEGRTYAPTNNVSTYTDPRSIYPPESWGSAGDGVKRENTALKRRIVHLESELEACLDLVNGLV